jgi:bisanhydrobacterioruberin hydratase
MDSLIKTGSVAGPIIALCLFALPSYVSTVRQRGGMGLLVLVLLGGYAIGIETLIIKAALPSASFAYDDVLGYKVFGITPWIVVLTYPPITLAAFWFASKFTVSYKRIALTSATAALLSMAIEPGLATLGFRQWSQEGVFYGVPLLNFVGWLLSTALVAGLLHHLWHGNLPVFRGIAYSGLLILLFWTGINIGIEHWIPAGIGASISGLILIVAGLEKWKTTHAIS